MKPASSSSSSSSSSSPPSSSSSTQEWSNYMERVRRFRKEKLGADPGLFAKDMAQLYYEQSISCPLPLTIEIPVLTLPLRVQIIRSDILGCSDALNPDSIRAIVDMVNDIYWQPQAGIRFELIQVNEPSINTHISETKCSTNESDGKIQGQVIDEVAINTFLTEKLRRGPDGKMMHKAERRTYILDILLASLGYRDAFGCGDAFDVWFLDMVGNGSQGMCIDRKTYTVLMGERSTKGYDVPTLRPHTCLAKTMAHELGHALRLNHPKGRYFEDGQSQIIHKNKKNLMQGGIDQKGGGGYFLEQWQICLARNAAEIFLKIV